MVVGRDVHRVAKAGQWNKSRAVRKRPWIKEGSKREDLKKKKFKNIELVKQKDKKKRTITY